MSAEMLQLCHPFTTGNNAARLADIPVTAWVLGVTFSKLWPNPADSARLRRRDSYLAGGGVVVVSRWFGLGLILVGSISWGLVVAIASLVDDASAAIDGGPGEVQLMAIE